MISKKIVNIVLFISAVLIWLMMLGFRYAEYDTNVLCFGIALLISGFVSMLITLAWLIKRQIVKDSMVSVILFLITSSPFSILVFLDLFVRFIGAYELKH